MLNLSELPEPIASFLSYKRVIQNRSKLTVEEYYNDLRTFFRYIIASRQNADMTDLSKYSIEDIDYDLISSVTTEEIYAFLLFEAEEKNNNSASRARKLSAIKSFYKYLTVKAGKLKNNPAKDIESPKKDKQLPKYLSLEESEALLSSVQRSSEHYYRDYCIITLFLNCGMRLSELVGINLSHIESDLSKMTVTGKGNKTRVIYLNSSCQNAISAYLSARQKEISKPGYVLKDKNALFLSGRGNRISNKTVQWMINKHLELAGLSGKGYSTHKLRHTAATLMYGTGKVDVRVLKDILGHEQLNTTQIYTHISDKQMKEAMDHNPLSRAKTKEAKNND